MVHGRDQLLFEESRMNPNCIDVVQATIGRTLKPHEVAAIDNAIVTALREFARAQPQEFAAMPQTERLQAAAQFAQQQHLNAAILDKQRASLAVMAQYNRTNELNAGIKAGKSGARAVYGVLEKADVYVKGVAPEFFSKIADAIHAVEPRFFGLIEDVRQARTFAHEVLNHADGSSGNPLSQKAAKVWLETIEAMRTRFNRAGGDIGKLAYGYLPQIHDLSRVRQVAREVWSQKVLPYLDRRQYVDETGKQMADNAMLDMLEKVHDTITTDGTNTMTPGAAQGSGMRANRGSEHRALHFKDADSYMAYNAEFGRGSVFSSMKEHITSLGRNIALTEHFGPNPNHTFSILDDLALKNDRGVRKFGAFGVTAKQVWATLSGDAGVVENQRLADIAQAARNIEVFGKLQGALVSSINDMATYFTTTSFNKIPLTQALSHLIKSFGADSKEFANRAGLVTESLIGDMTRWNEANLKDGWTSKIADATMRMSLLTGWTNAIRRGFSTAMMGGLGKISRTDWAKLHIDDRTRLEAKGVTQNDFKVWNMATPEDWRGSSMLTPDSIRAVTDAQLMAANMISQAPTAAEGMRVRDQAVSRLLGVIADESEYASVAPDLHAKTLTTWGGQHRGTVGGEIARSVMLFKGFPLAMLTRHYGRMTGDAMAPSSRVGYAASLIIGNTALGAVAMELKDILGGKDPRDVTDPKFWAAAVAQGGGYGFAGDLIYQAMGGMQSQTGVSTAANLLSSVAGPVAGSLAEFGDLTLGNLGQAIKGKDTHFGAEAVRFVRSHTPFVNLWYARAALDHAVLNDLQEFLSPGYLAKVERRAQKDWGQGYYWPLAQGTPERAPDFSNMGGR